jgi:non-homologous end joining protein Ku
VGRALTNKTTGVIIDRADVVRRAEATSGAWVTLDDDEIVDATMPKGIAVIETFIQTRNLGQYLTEGLYQIRPRRVKGKSDPSGVKALTLLLAAMKERKVVALVKLAMRGPARYAILDCAGDLRYVVTADAIRQPIDLPTATVSKQESDLALALIESVGVSAPVLVDTTSQAIQTYVDNKAAGVEPAVVLDAQPSGPDLLSDLMASINANKGKVAV